MYIAPKNSWYLERIIWLIAGTVVLVSLLLAVTINSYWLILTAVVGLNLVIFSLSGFCIMANILVKLGAVSGITREQGTKTTT